MAEVRLQEGESLENALRRFKRKVQQEDIVKEVKRHSYYLKPGEKKRVKAALALLGRSIGPSRSPVAPLSAEKLQKMKASLQQAKLL